MLLSGDAFNHPAQLEETDWASGSDDDAAAANASRRRLLDELVDLSTVLAPTHFAEPFGRAVRREGRVTWVPT